MKTVVLAFVVSCPCAMSLTPGPEGRRGGASHGTSLASTRVQR